MKITGCYGYVVSINKDLSAIKVQKRKDIISIQIPSGKRFFFFGWVINIFALHRLLQRKAVTYVHAWCTSAGAVGAILKQFNKSIKLIIDSFEPHAEAMVENKTWSKRGLKFRTLFHYEKKEARMADHLIFAAQGMENYIREKYKVAVKNYDVKPACIDLEAFSEKALKNKELLDKYKLNDKIVCVYAGKFGGIYLEDDAFQFIKACENYWGADRFKFLLLSNADDGYVSSMISAYGIKPATVVKLFVLQSEVAQYMGLADFALSPIKSVPTKRYCTPIKDGEYWALGLPVVITPNISNDSDIIKQHDAGAILDGLNDVAYLKAIKQIDAIISGKSRAEVYKKIRPLAEQYRNFSIAEGIYLKLYGKSRG